MASRAFPLWMVMAGCVAFGGRASAQEVIDQPAAPPAHISLVDGTAWLVRDGRAEAAGSNMPLLEGDRLRTDAGRLEVLLPDGSLLHLDENTTVDLLSGSLMRLALGRLIFIVSGRPDERPSLDYQIDAPSGAARIARPGEYRVSLVQGRAGPDVELAVVRGEATLANDLGSVIVRAGQYSLAVDGYAPMYPEAFNSARLDAFTRWSAGQIDAHVGYVSQQYLPAEVRVYSGAFDRYGTWETVQPYGYVWYPTVHVGWRPYYEGYWRSVGPFGWTWIGHDPWGWPTHHYGRWGIGARGWFWIPGRSWGPAWVSWGIGIGHVGWCPLGWNDRPVLGLTVVNNYFGGRRHDPWSAWTVVPRHAFGGVARVSSAALQGDAFRAAARTGFAVQRVAPPAPARAVARPFGLVSGSSSAAGRAVPRGSVSVSARDRRPPAGASAPISGSSEVRPSPRPSAGAARTSETWHARPGTAVPRAPQSATGLPPRDSRPRSLDRSPGAAPSRAPAAAARPGGTSDAVYGGSQDAATARESAPRFAPDRAVPRVPDARSPGSSEAEPLRPSRGWAQPEPDAGARTYGLPDARATAPQAIERRPRAEQVTPSTADRDQAADQRMPGSVAYERRAPAPVAVPRAPERSWGAPPPMSVPPRVERWSPPTGYSAPPRSSAPMAVPRAPERSSTPPRVERQSPPTGYSAPPRSSAPMAVPRGPERPPAPPRVSAPPRAERSSPPAVSRAPQQSAPARSRPPGGGSPRRR